MTLYILNYNNYYNRIMKKYDTIAEYADYVIYSLTGTNFNPNDNVDTQHVVGSVLNPYGGEGNYAIVVDSNNTIVSRWFIIDATRNDGIQWTITMHRDVIADFYEKIIDAPCFVEKGLVNKQDPAIFNSENMTFNQIKKSEYLLKDGSNSAWIVGYLSRQLVEDKPIEIQFPAYYDFSAATLSDFDAYQSYSSVSDLRTYDNINYQIIWYFEEYGDKKQKRLTCNEAGSLISSDYTYNEPTTFVQIPSSNATVENYLSSAIPYNLRQHLSARTTPIFKNSDLKNIKKYDNKILRVGTETFTYYKIRLAENKRTGVNELLTGKDEPALYNSVFDPVISQEYMKSTTSSVTTETGIRGKNDFTEYYLAFTDVTESYVTTVNITIPAKRNQLLDAPYDMFCIAVDPITLGGTRYALEDVIGVASGLYTQLAGGDAGYCYDIQYLPYCPLENFVDLKTWGLVDLNEEYDYVYIKSGDTNKSIMFFPKRSSFKTIISHNINVENYSALDFKIANETDVYRLCSPNYNGVFEFSATKNGGVQYFEVNCTYKPYNPYIHLNPNWSRLYGSDFNDARGLILGGDFSIAAMTSAWETYQLQNKNYEAIFNRDIQSMELKNNIQREQDLWSAGAGMLTGAASGATTGALSGGGVYGAIAGGVAGGIISAIGGARDINLNEMLRNDALDYTKDMYNYNLGNIQALPNSLSKSSAFDINNKIFPFLEYYTCTDKEKDALREKIKYNGMTVMRIDKINNYIYSDESYVKGKIIRIEDFEEDYHILNTIGSEVNKGFFTKGE